MTSGLGLGMGELKHRQPVVSLQEEGRGLGLSLERCAMPHWEETKRARIQAPESLPETTGLSARGRCASPRPHSQRGEGPLDFLLGSPSPLPSGLTTRILLQPGQRRKRVWGPT